MLHGLLLINKPSGITSHDVVARVRRILNTKSVGHAGTLDPIASGLMVLLIGEGTKLSHYILEQNKAYRLTARLGQTTDTFDTTGKILTSTDQRPQVGEVLSAALNLKGELDLPVPIFSATKIDGKKLYEYAREDKPVEVPIKKMTFFDLKLEHQDSDSISMFLRCSKGSFIRAWIQKLGEVVKVGAVMSALERVESMPYRLDQAVTFEELEACEKTDTMKGFVPMIACLQGAPLIRIKGQDQVMMGNGLISHDLKNMLIGVFRPESAEVPIKIVSQATGELLALVGLEPNKGFVIRRVFRYQ